MHALLAAASRWHGLHLGLPEHMECRLYGGEISYVCFHYAVVLQIVEISHIYIFERRLPLILFNAIQCFSRLNVADGMKPIW